MRLIRNLHLIPEKTALQEFEATDDYKKLVKQVAREAFDDVIPRLHTVRGGEQKPKLYEQDGDRIRIEDRTFEFLKSHSQVITQLAIVRWLGSRSSSLAPK